jgi:hypothetical protein
MSLNVVVLLYLVASVFFIQALKGLSHPSTSRRGNVFGMVGMAIAMVTTVALISSWRQMARRAGHGLGAARPGDRRRRRHHMAKKVEMTKMPELVAFMHSMIGLAAVFIAIAAVAEPWAFNIVELPRRRDADRQPDRAVHRRLRRCDHLQRLGDRLRQAVGQVQVPPVPGCAGGVLRPAHDQPGARHAMLGAACGSPPPRPGCLSC